MLARFAALVFCCCACAGTTIDVTAYHRGCANDSDCALVYAGDVCVPCACPNAAVATSDLSKFEKDSASLETHCSPNRPMGDCAPCVSMQPFCLDGTCSAHAQ